MGGDFAPASVVEGAQLAHRKYPHIRFQFFGREDAVRPLLEAEPSLALVSEIFHCDSAISADEKPSVAVRQGKGSSMWEAIRAATEGRAHAVVSAGNTGALMAISKLQMRTLPGIYRPAICAQMPTKTGQCAVLDLGANVDCDAATLHQFGVMGSAFARAVFGMEAPSVGLLNIGTEQLKGNETLREAYDLMAGESLRGSTFHGFIEANDINAGVVDVVVTDGFTGNVALKMSEGTASLISSMIRRTFTETVFAKIAYLLAKPSFKQLRKRLDPRKYNGAMFIGLNGIAVKSHGGADGYSFYHALKVAIDSAQSDINARIRHELSQVQEIAPEAPQRQKEPA
jgi:phosphate acyltransferase